ncbi:hypothetical protein AURDEDRAFT_188369 [Auricularia subglabra TFB-10046 SS5]|uniref:Uncharacterized protein n=1 Tax=Auricularia subglabra (strain TFB-10046 / SS5) TaxID=717982 RepID=J0CYX5_AURST|nr:hypothetical protein AURDEDRAFT_188369 [Auricularia subglabra TFB-10046 SS5]
MSLALGLAGVAQASDAAGQSVTRALFGVAHLIAESARNVKVNKAASLRLARRVNEFVTAITTELEQRQDEEPSDEWLHALANFQDILTDVYAHIQKQANRSYLSQILHQEKDADALDTLLSRAQGAYDALMVGARMRIHELLDAVNESWETSNAMDELLTHREAINPTRPAPDPLCVPALPHRPHNFFGRDQEVDTVVTTLVRPEAGSYVAILGGPGMGKTSLALNVLHTPALVDHFGDARYFIACDAADGQSTLVQLISAAFGMCTSSSAALKKRLTVLSRGRPALLVLDNFESAWETPELRQDAEQLLQVLAEVPLLSIITTLRGTERPLGLSWTRPFLPPLQPLRDDAAMMTFATISDVDESDAHMTDLIAVTENVPLALVLMANLAQYESPAGLLARWNQVHTAMLRRGGGRDRLSSLDVSITLSVQSHRVSSSPDAANVLSLLSLVPNGVMETDLAAWSSELDTHRAVSTLVQTALGYRTSEQRVRVLAPIRSFMLSRHPPSDSLARGVYDYYFNLAELVFKAGVDTSGYEAVSSISPELENVQSVIRHALNHSSNLRPAVRAAVCMSRLYNDTGMGGPSLMTEALAVSRREGMDDQTAALLHQWALMSCNTSMPGDPETLFTESRALHERLGNVEGVIDLTLHLSWYVPPGAALATCQEMRDLAEARGDRWRVARCDQALCRVYERLGDRHRAREYLDSSVEIIRAEYPKEYRQLGWGIFRQGDIASDCGDIAVAVEKMRESIPILRRSGYLLGLATAEFMLGDTLLRQGYVSQAVPHLESALRSCRTGGLSRREITCLLGLTSAHLLMGDHDQAERVLQSAEEVVRGSGNSWSIDVCNVSMGRARVKLSMGDIDEARAHLMGARAAGRMHDSGVPFEDLRGADASVLLWLGHVEKAAGNLDSAATWLIAAAVANASVDIGATVVRALCALLTIVDDDFSALLMETVFAPLTFFYTRRV